MPIERVHSFLVHPGKHIDPPPPISGTSVPRGKLFSMLEALFEKSTDDCDTDIVFRPDEHGQQQNEARELLVNYVRQPSIRTGRAMASRLQEMSTKRSGLGLFFLLGAKVGRAHAVMLSRFPADEGIVAKENADDLDVEFIERIFMKNAKTYKCAVYSSESLDRGFWDGRAVDRQVTGVAELSHYWIRDFLASELRTTSAAGTRRLAQALKSAIDSAPTEEVRQELVAATTVLRGQHTHRGSASYFVNRLRLSDPAKDALRAAFPRPELMEDSFEFDRAEFDKNIAFRAVELDNGGMMVAEAARFDQIFRPQPLDGANGATRYTTEGLVVGDRLRKKK
jgi:hypothetical protein